MKINDNIQYLEGQWAASSLRRHIEISEYKTLENAIETKNKLIKHFEENFGFSRTMENIDSSYAYNLGMYDALMKIKKEEEHE